MLYTGPYGDLYQTHVNPLSLIFLLLLPFPQDPFALLSYTSILPPGSSAGK